MNQVKKLRIKENMTAMRGNKTAICGVEIYEVVDGYTEVILSEPEGVEYKGVSTTNHFEYFASKIKSEMLADTPNHLIVWKDRLEFHNPAFPDYEAKVVMDYNGALYSNPQWVRG